MEKNEVITTFEASVIDVGVKENNLTQGAEFVLI